MTKTLGERSPKQTFPAIFLVFALAYLATGHLTPYPLSYLVKSLPVFALTLESYEEPLLEWAERFPSLTQPHLALAVYYHALGWKRRWNSATPTSSTRCAAASTFTDARTTRRPWPPPSGASNCGRPSTWGT